jgi:hypothetical protein
MRSFQIEVLVLVSKVLLYGEIGLRVESLFLLELLVVLGLQYSMVLFRVFE